MHSRKSISETNARPRFVSDLSRGEAELHQAEQEPQAAAIFETHYESHDLANLFPRLEGPGFDDLVADIRAHGLREDIALLDGKILDGRNRYRACMLARVEPRFFHFLPRESGDPLAYVISKNVRRRHLVEGQRAMAAAKIADMRQGERTDIEPSPNLGKVDQTTAAKMLNVSTGSVQSATAVRKNAIPALIHVVEQAKLSVSAAAKAARLAPDIQEKVAALAKDGRRGDARSLIKKSSAGTPDEKSKPRQKAHNKAKDFMQKFGPEGVRFIKELQISNYRLFSEYLWKLLPPQDTGQAPLKDGPPPTCGPAATKAVDNKPQPNPQTGPAGAEPVDDGLTLSECLRRVPSKNRAQKSQECSIDGP